MLENELCILIMLFKKKGKGNEFFHMKKSILFHSNLLLLKERRGEKKNSRNKVSQNESIKKTCENVF